MGIGKIRHWTPRYIYNRLAVIIYLIRRPDTPWLTQTSIAMLESWLRPTDRGLEWGSGRSTAWFAARTAHLRSIEHDPQWAKKVENVLRQRRINERVDYRCEEDGSEERPDSRYVLAAADIPVESIDYCLVDGVSREHCILMCLEKIKPGGLLILDNANWYLPHVKNPKLPGSRQSGESIASENWEKFAQNVENWRCMWTTNGVVATALWVKPL